MKRMQWIERIVLLVAIVACTSLSAQAAGAAKLTVDVDKPGHKVSPTLWGIFFEDINLSADGGIYPELVRNRSFEDADKLENWKFTSTGDGKSEASVITADVQAKPPVPPLNAFNRKSLCVKVDGAFTLQNEGYWGMNIVKGDGYMFKLAARGMNGFNGPLTVRVLSSSGNELAKGQITGLTGDWNYRTLDFTATDSDPKAKLQISASGKGTLFLDMVSLMPKKTWKGHGLRTDLAESLNGLHPAFMRFPGGCWVEGDDFAHMNHWKNTIGDIDTRTPLWNIWGYNATHGLGFYEYLQLAEDLGAEPLFCINIGMSHKETIPMDRMAQWVQDALDAIEYANGPTNSIWGAMRAAAGHPAPFNLKYMEIGNENGGFRGYVEHWDLFYKAIRDKYPEIKFVADGWDKFGDNQPDIVDDHYYDSPEWFMRHANQYDKTDRNGPKVFVGEYAVTQNAGKGNLRAAIGEAAFMTGLERNSDVVIMASYAPLLVNLNHRAWNPDLINFDSSRWYGLPGYYVQKMFSENRGDVTLPVTVDTGAVTEKPATGCIGVGTWNTAAEFKDIKVTAPDGKVLFASDFSTNSAGWKLLGDGEWTVQDGALRQTAEREFVRAIAGDRSWKDYTIELKARKISGREGFLILFHVNDEEDRVWWNIGGWDNTQNAVELDEAMDWKPGSIETGRWYDIRVEVKGASIRCWLDGKLIHDLQKTSRATRRLLYASATREEKSGAVAEKPATGCIGVGTWNTAAEFKDIKVTAPDGKVLFASDFSKNSDGWKLLGDGEWKVQDGALQQTAEKEFIRAIAGDKSWTDYTLELKARKSAGLEGFLILFHITDDEDRVWWNIGGWDNTQNAVELDGTQDGKPGFIEPGRWYDIRIEVKGASVKCWLDGKLIHDLGNPRPTTGDEKSSAVAEKPATGCIGVGTWNTAAEFKDIKVTAPDGKVLFTSDFSKNSDGWKLLGDGEWKVQDGALQQTAEKEFIRAIAGDKSWIDYTLELKARKLSGLEGFLILFHINDDEDRVWWNIGGWNNTQHAVELDGTQDGKPGLIETGRWYDIRVEVKGTSIRCWLDGKLIHKLGNPGPATRDEKSGDVIVKVVNTSADAVETEINLNGMKDFAGSAQAIVLTSEKATDENSLDNPTKVSPKPQTLDVGGANFRHTFPGNSLTVIRVKAQ